MDLPFSSQLMNMKDGRADRQYDLVQNAGLDMFLLHYTAVTLKALKLSQILRSYRLSLTLSLGENRIELKQRILFNFPCVHLHHCCDGIQHTVARPSFTFYFYGLLRRTECENKQVDNACCHQIILKTIGMQLDRPNLR